MRMRFARAYGANRMPCGISRMREGNSSPGELPLVLCCEGCEHASRYDGILDGESEMKMAVAHRWARYDGWVIIGNDAWCKNCATKAIGMKLPIEEEITRVASVLRSRGVDVDKMLAAFKVDRVSPEDILKNLVARCTPGRRMATGSDCIPVLRRFCESWGGQIIELTRDQFTGLFRPGWDPRCGAFYRGLSDPNVAYEEAPATSWHGLHYADKLVYVVPDEASPNGLIHEMGHVFATRYLPDYVDELDTLGWEVCLARASGLYRQWSDANADYCLGGNEGYDWHVASAAYKARVVRTSIIRGIELGSIEPMTLAPRSVR